ncbi:MAG: hypothetical protein K5672_09275 [Bacteroidaceae bacterium]|nr:hypothetical protein [Bacteroidaceae bacterium]
MAKDDKRNKVLIDLSDSTYAHSFEEQNRIHQVEFDAAVNLVVNQINRIPEQKDYKKGMLDRVHNTISVFGDRGTGKTSFIRSLFDEIEKRCKGDEEVVILGLIDPTLMEEKAHIFLLIISLINDRVEKIIEEGTCEPGGEAYKQRMDWNACVKKLAKGLPSLDKVGNDYNNTSWQDDEFIMQKGLDDIMAAYQLEENFHNMVDMALKILGKKAFVIAFDDIDINMEKGWRVLETIRKYLTTPKIISLLSGNMYLYNLNVRGQQWEQFGTRLLSKERRDYHTLVNQLENQYMLKVFKAENRLHLYPLLYSIRLHNMEYRVKGAVQKETKIDEAYRQVLNNYGVCSAASQKVFADYLMGLSIRSQINYLKINWDTNGNNFSISSIEAFLSRMYAAGIEVQLAYANPNLLNTIVLNYLTKEKDNSLRDTYLLMPSTDKPEDNACLAGLSTIFASQTSTYPGLLFDYMIRVGYLRNLILSCKSRDGYEGLIEFGSFKHDVSLKNIVGTSMAYKLKDDPKGDGMKIHKAIYGLNGRAKKKGMDKIDDVLEGQKSAQKVMGYVPLCALQYETKNESQLYYSFYLLLGCIGVLLRTVPESANLKEDEKEKRNIQEAIKGVLKDMAQLRCYAVPSKDSGSATPQDETETSTEVFITDDDEFTEFVEKIRTWINAYYALEKAIPAYVIGRILTRFHQTAMKIEADNLGDYMHRIVVAFINACLIEECKEYLLSRHEDASLTKLNFNNAVTSDKVFVDNLSYVTSEYEDTLVLTGWIAESPLIWPYLKKELVDTAGWSKLKDCYDSKFGTYEVLQQVVTKESRIPFLYARDTYMGTYTFLLANGYDIQKLDVAEVSQDLIDELKDYFSAYVTKNSVEGFLTKLKKAHMAPFAEEAETAAES